MLYLADSRAKILAQQEQAQVSMDRAQDCGLKWQELLVKFDLDSSSWKTHHCLFPEDLPPSLVTLPKWGMMRNGHVFQHPTLERPISVTEYGLLPTPKASDSIRMDCPSERRRRSPCLESVVKTYPTPQASDYRNRGHLGMPVIQRRVMKKKQICLSMSVSDTSGALNPDWVEWLMGWPIGWTDLKPLAMDRFQSWKNAHLTPSHKAVT